MEYPWILESLDYNIGYNNVKILIFLKLNPNWVLSYFQQLAIYIINFKIYDECIYQSKKVFARNTTTQPERIYKSIVERIIFSTVSRNIWIYFDYMLEYSDKPRKYMP